MVNYSVWKNVGWPVWLKLQKWLATKKKKKTWQIDIWLFCFQQINNWGKFILQVIQNIIMIKEKKTKTFKNNV